MIGRRDARVASGMMFLFSAYVVFATYSAFTKDVNDVFLLIDELEAGLPSESIAPMADTLAHLGRETNAIFDAFHAFCMAMGLMLCTVAYFVNRLTKASTMERPGA